jgi:hypothetical protein
MVSMNIFRFLADLSHTLSKCILIWAIHSNSSAEGVSLITQAFYCVVFLTRYMDYFRDFYESWWNTLFKTFYILSSLYILFIMLRVYARTRERETAWKLGGACLGGSAIITPFVMMIFRRKFQWSWVEVCLSKLYISLSTARINMDSSFGYCPLSLNLYAFSHNFSSFAKLPFLRYSTPITLSP